MQRLTVDLGMQSLAVHSGTRHLVAVNRHARYACRKQGLALKVLLQGIGLRVHARMFVIRTRLPTALAGQSGSSSLLSEFARVLGPR
eukprot:6181058-Pleurochrysis_carterae.AAC.2